MNENFVENIRSFNRFYTKIIGLLNDRLHNTNHSLTSSRVLYEIYNSKECTAADLSKELGIDQAFLSRTLKKFEKEGLVKKKEDAKDGRKQNLSLTEKGKKIFLSIQEVTKEHVGKIISGKSEKEKKELVGAMNKIINILGNDINENDFLTFRTHRPGDIGYLSYQHSLFYSREYGFDITFDSYVAGAMVKFIDDYDENKERLWIVENEEKILGSIAIVKGDENGVAQLRWFLLEPEVHGKGVGKKLMNDAVSFCREKGYRKIILWTFSDLKAARALYERHGFEINKIVKHKIWGQDIEEEKWDLILN